MTATTVRAEDQTTQQSTDKREANGHFAKGNKGGPGDPFARQVAALRQTLLNRATQKDFEEVADELIKKAKTGDVAAVKLLFQYTLGKPAPSADPDHLDVDEWHKLQQYSCPPAEMNAIFNGFPQHGLRNSQDQLAAPNGAAICRSLPPRTEGVGEARSTQSGEGSFQESAVTKGL